MRLQVYSSPTMYLCHYVVTALLALYDPSGPVLLDSSGPMLIYSQGPQLPSSCLYNLGALRPVDFAMSTLSSGTFSFVRRLHDSTHLNLLPYPNWLSPICLLHWLSPCLQLPPALLHRCFHFISPYMVGAPSFLPFKLVSFRCCSPSISENCRNLCSLSSLVKISTICQWVRT